MLKKLALTVAITALSIGSASAGDCLSGRVDFEAEKVNFGSTAAAQASFVFTETPEPGSAASIATALAAIAAMRAAKSRAVART